MMASALELLRTDIGDYGLRQIRWADEQDVVLVFDAVDLARVAIRFRGVQNLSIDIDFGEYAGIPLVYGVAITADGTQHRVVITFGAAPEGQIDLVCSDASIEAE